MIEFVTGNFFDFEADARVNTVNCVGVMGAGAALQFKDRYPKMFEEYLQECRLGRVKIGKPHVWIDQEFFNHSPKIINFPTKDHWRKPSEYDYVEKGLVWLRNYLAHQDIRVLTLPALGCGHGGLDWAKVKPMIQEALSDLSTKILVFEPESSTKIESSPELESELGLKRIKKIIPGDASYPTELTGKSATEIYLRGNKNLLQHPCLLSFLIGNKPSEKEQAAVTNCLQALDKSRDYVCVMAYNTSFEIDQIKIILEKSIKVILLIPSGILNLKLRKDIRALWNEDRMLVISLSKPKQNWSPIENMKSLKFRLQVSKAVVITQEQLDFFQKMEKDFLSAPGEFFYLNYWTTQPELFIKLGAQKIGRDKETLLPKLNPVLEYLENHASRKSR